VFLLAVTSSPAIPTRPAGRPSRILRNKAWSLRTKLRYRVIPPWFMRPRAATRTIRTPGQDRETTSSHFTMRCSMPLFRTRSGGAGEIQRHQANGGGGGGLVWGLSAMRARVSRRCRDRVGHQRMRTCAAFRVTGEASRCGREGRSKCFKDGRTIRCRAALVSGVAAFPTDGAPMTNVPDAAHRVFLGVMASMRARSPMRRR